MRGRHDPVPHDQREATDRRGSHLSVSAAGEEGVAARGGIRARAGARERGAGLPQGSLEDHPGQPDERRQAPRDELPLHTVSREEAQREGHGPLRRLLPGSALALWGAVVLAIYTAGTTWLTGPCLAALRTPLLALVITYSLALTGSRVARRMGRWFPAGADPLERTLLELALGIGSALVILFAGGAFHLYSTTFAWGLLAVSWIGPHRAFLSDLRARAAHLASRGSSSTWAGVLAIAGTITLIESLAPVVAQDALVYHLAVPAKWIEAGGFVPIAGNFFASFPQNVELLFAWGLLLDGDSLAQWFHWFLGALSAASCASLARALPGRTSGLTAAAIFATVPTVTLIAGWAYVDLGVVFFATASLLGFVRWVERDEAPWLLASALLAGLAAGCKYT